MKKELIRMTAAERRTEALELLELFKLDPNESMRLDALTDYRFNGDEYGDRRAWQWSIEDCLKLRFPPDTELVLYPARNMVEVHITGGMLMGGVTTFEASTLPLAMLRAWWTMQAG